MERALFTVQLARYAITASSTLFIYEFLILLNREYEAIYKSRWSLTKFLYLGCRFTPLIATPIFIYGIVFDRDRESCGPLVIIFSIIYILYPVLPQCIYVLRAWVFTGAKRWTLFIYLPCLFGYFFVICWHSLYHVGFSKGLFLLFGRAGCFKAPPEPEVMIIHGRVIKLDYTRRMLIAAIGLDFVVGLMVVIHCIRIQTIRARLGRLLYTQGLLYFSLMLFLNIGAITIASFDSFRGYDMLGFSAVLVGTSVMACRFVLQIKEYSLKDPLTHEIRVRPEFIPSGSDPSSRLEGSESFALSNRMPSFRSRRVSESDSRVRLNG